MGKDAYRDNPFSRGIREVVVCANAFYSRSWQRAFWNCLPHDTERRQMKISVRQLCLFYAGCIVSFACLKEWGVIPIVFCCTVYWLRVYMCQTIVEAIAIVAIVSLLVALLIPAVQS